MRKEYTPIRRAYAVVGFVAIVAGIIWLAGNAGTTYNEIKDIPDEYCELATGHCISAVDHYRAGLLK
jgi:hypothetical protein